MPVVCSEEGRLLASVTAVVEPVLLFRTVTVDDPEVNLVEDATE